jgi:hypothetical protein
MEKVPGLVKPVSAASGRSVAHRVANKSAAPVQITAEQIVREAFESVPQKAPVSPRPHHHISQ